MEEAVHPRTRQTIEKVVAMKGLVPAPKGRTRNPVGHKYLEALQANISSDSKSSSSGTPPPEYTGLDLLVLGITSGTAMDDIDFALCRFTQASPEAPLHLDIIQVCALGSPQRKTQLMLYSTIALLCPRKYEPISSPCYETTLPRQVCCLRWMRKWARPSQTPSIYLHRNT